MSPARSAGTADPELARAQDPHTPMGHLMVLAGTRPDLRPVIATNVGCSSDLRAWIERLEVADDVRASSRSAGGASGNAEADSLAPLGWSPSDPSFDDSPFGSVLGDPLMGSPLFDVSVLDAALSGADGSDAPDTGGDTGEGAGAQAPVPTLRTVSGRTGPARTGRPTAAPTSRPTTRPASSAPTVARTTARTTAPAGGPPTVRPSAPYGSVMPPGLLGVAPQGVSVRPPQGPYAGPPQGYGYDGAGVAARQGGPMPSRQAESAPQNPRRASADAFRVPPGGHLAPQQGSRGPVGQTRPQPYRPEPSRQSSSSSSVSAIIVVIVMIVIAILRALT